MRLLALLLAIALAMTGLQEAAVFGDPVGDRLPASVQVQLGHKEFVNSVAVSPDGKFALSAGGFNQAGELKLWEVATGREMRSFVVHAEVINSVTFSPDGKLALSGGDKTLKLWEVSSGREIRAFTGHAEEVTSVTFSPDGQFALSGSRDNTIQLWEVASGREIRRFTGHTGDVTSVTFSPDGQFALSGSRDKTVKLWEVATGRELRTFIGHANWINCVTFSPDGQFVLSGGGEPKVTVVGGLIFLGPANVSVGGELKLWEVATGLEVRSFVGLAGDVRAVAFSPDSQFALSGDADNALKLWDVATGRELRSFAGHTDVVASVAFTPDSKFVLSGSYDKTMKLWDVATGRELHSFAGRAEAISSVAFSPDGNFALSGSEDKTLKLWDVANGRWLRTFKGHRGEVTSVAFSRNGKFALSGSEDKTLKLWDVTNGRQLRSFEAHTDIITALAFSPDYKFLLSGSCDERHEGADGNFCWKGSMKLWQVAKGRVLRSFKGLTGDARSLAFSPDGRSVLSGDIHGTVQLWEVASGRELRSFESDMRRVFSVAFSPDGRFALSGGGDIGVGKAKLWEVATGRELSSFTGHSGYVYSVAFSPNGKYALSGSVDKTLKLWDVVTGRELRTLKGHAAAVSSVAFSPDGRFVLSGGYDGTLRLWDAAIGRELVQMSAASDGEWTVMTPEGFFSSSSRDTDMLTIVRELETASIGQVHQSLFNPDLVRESLAGDPDGEVRRASEVVNLEKVLEAGPPPIAAITSHTHGSQSSADLVTVAARITDRGKGIGRIEWRVNGVTVGVMAAPAGRGPDYDVKQQLALDPGENRIEVIAYEGRNLLASLPAQTTIVYDGPADTAKPKLFILAIGINAYEDYGWSPPGSGLIYSFPPLGASVPDAKAFSTEMEKAGAGLYVEVRVTLALDADATAAKLDDTVTRLAKEIGPRDTFVLYAAAHGYSLGGNYYMIPQDYQGGPKPEALKTRAIGQERLQDWIANRIKAKKALILLDTCESGALTGGYTNSRTEGPVSEAAVGRLHEATGRPVLTAASPNKHAYENYKGHGVFTYALMEALHKGDTNNNGMIEVTELAAHVEKRVPELFAELKQDGWVVKGLAPAAVPRGETGEEDKTQTAHFGSTGEDFSLVARLP